MTGRAALIAVYIFFNAGLVQAQEAVDLKNTAKSEIQQAGELSARSTDAQVSGGMLSLKDPLQEIRTRSWSYFMRFSVQSFRPQGSGTNDLAGQRFNLGDVDSTILPSLALGFELPLLSQPSLKWGIEARGAYTTEKAHAHFNTGYVENDAQLNSSLLSVDPYLRFSFARWPQLSLNLGGEFGTVNYTQSSANKLAGFSEHSSFMGYDLGVEYALGRHVSLLLNYAHRQTSKTVNAQLPPDNYELGTRFQW